MNILALFRNGQAGAGERAQLLAHELLDLTSEVQRLHQELLKTQGELRALQTEQARVHADVNRWMRRAVAAERRQLGGAADAASAPALPAASAAPVSRIQARRLGLRGVALRRALRDAGRREAANGHDEPPQGDQEAGSAGGGE